jgi:oligogalacturonide lyase
MAVAGRLSAPEWQPYTDPATDWEVTRLTSPAFSSGMTAPHLFRFSRHGDSLLYWSERTGTRQAWLLDLKTGASRQLTDTAGLDPLSLSLTPDERSLHYFDDMGLINASLHDLKTRIVYRVSEGATRFGMTVAADGSILFAENKAGGASILRAGPQHVNPILDTEGEIDLLIARPRHPQLIYRSKGNLWLVNTDGSGRRQVTLDAGQTGEILWVPSGRTLIYLHIPDDPKQLISLRECAPDESTDHEIAHTSQFATVYPNGDASVFAGASRSRASAYVLILLRVTRRELTVCEHRASNPAMVSPVFSPDSQSVFFVSDRHGKPAIYRVKVEKFVEETG